MDNFFETVINSEKAIKKLKIKRALSKEERDEIAIRFQHLLNLYLKFFD